MRRRGLGVWFTDAAVAVVAAACVAVMAWVYSLPAEGAAARGALRLWSRLNGGGLGR